MAVKKHINMLAALGQEIDNSNAESSPAKTAVAKPLTAGSVDRVAEASKSSSKMPGRPPSAEKTVPLLVRVPSSLHDWLTDRMVKETRERRRPVTVQTIILKTLAAARDTSN
ncbi:hypothetical protein [Acidisoma sp. S159]|uniref:hypothetical protein n=1 Tax=Acidisoma sp. S159 TaxID=1747225 RepID=UPI00131E3FB2|nr:hypothetical protein [Acidisoma sp. S159]